jgi:hypothetical protein
MFELKPISSEAIDRSLAKVDRYRLLNEPREAESICRDILASVPNHQEALVGLLLSLTDQFGRQPSVRPVHAREVLEKLDHEYARAYYAGVISERWAKALLGSGDPEPVAYECFVEAMGFFAKAQELSTEGNDDAILRWNACARIIAGNPKLRPRPDDELMERGFMDSVPH